MAPRDIPGGHFPHPRPAGTRAVNYMPKRRMSFPLKGRHPFLVFMHHRKGEIHSSLPDVDLAMIKQGSGMKFRWTPYIKDTQKPLIFR
jgi:hypothetical protein